MNGSCDTARTPGQQERGGGGGIGSYDTHNTLPAPSPLCSRGSGFRGLGGMPCAQACAPCPWPVAALQEGRCSVRAGAAALPLHGREGDEPMRQFLSYWRAEQMYGLTQHMSDMWAHTTFNNISEWRASK